MKGASTPVGQQGGTSTTPRYSLTPIIIGTLCTIAFAAVVPFVNLLAHSTDPTRGYLPVGAFAVLVVLWSGPRLAGVLRRWRLSQQDVLLVYCMLLGASGLSSIIFFLLPVMTTPFYYAPIEPLWTDLFHRFIPSWMVVSDQRAVLELFQGSRSARAPWEVWAVPLLTWGLLISLFYFTSLCLVGILRHRWIHEEKLVFPLAQIPLEVVGIRAGFAATSTPLYRDKKLWIGIAAPALLHSLNTLHSWFPSIPGIQLNAIPLGQAFVDRPWNVMSDLRLHFSFATVGIAYLLPTRFSFSFVFFFFLQFVQRMLLDVSGWTGAASWNPWHIGLYQQQGAMMMAACYLFWSARHGLRKMIRPLWRRHGDAPPHPDRWMLLGFGVGLAALGAWSGVAGVPLWVGLAFFATVFATMLCFAWMAAGAGIPVAQVDNLPQQLLLAFAGVQGLGAKSLTIIAFQERVLTYSHQHALAPTLCQTFKVADAAHIPLRRLFAALIIALVAGMSVGIIATLWLTYREGGVKLSPTWFYGHANRVPFTLLTSHLSNRTPPSREEQLFLLSGALLMGGMMMAYRRFLWLPIHPIGFLMAYGWQITALWFSLLIGGVLAGLVNRYGGAQVYQRGRPLFLGFVIGELMTAALWGVLDSLLGITHHSIPVFI